MTRGGKRAGAGAPRKPAAEKRRHRVVVLLNDAERDAVAQMTPNQKRGALLTGASSARRLRLEREWAARRATAQEPGA